MTAPTLAAWLLEQIAEDEADALRLCPGRNAKNGKWVRGAVQDVAVRAIDPHAADHVLRHDPARVLAECEAKRAIVEDAASYEPSHSVTDGLSARVLAILALPYADRPGYRDEWLP